MNKIDNYLEKIMNKTKISQEQKNYASKWIKIIKEKIEQYKKINTIKVFKTGSYNRQTAINPLSDVDIFIVLDNEKHKKKV